jgi:hypothetical protein
MAGVGGVQDRRARLITPQVLPGIGIDRVQPAAERPDEEPPAGDDGLDTGLKPFVREQAVPLPRERRPQLGRRRAAARGVMAKHGPIGAGAGSDGQPDDKAREYANHISFRWT